MKPAIFYAILSLLVLLTAPASATVSITVNSNGGSAYCDTTGNLLTTGCVVRVGFFDISAPGSLLTLQTSDDFATVDSFFKPLGEGIPNAGTINQTGSLTNYLVVNGMFAPGALFGQITGIDASYLTPGSDLSIWVFNNADPQSASEWGIYTASTGWEFPSDLGSATLSTFEIDNVVRGLNTGTQFQLSSISAVPEPGGLLLLLIAGGCFSRRRRP